MKTARMILGGVEYLIKYTESGIVSIRDSSGAPAPVDVSRKAEAAIFGARLEPKTSRTYRSDCE